MGFHRGSITPAELETGTPIVVIGPGDIFVGSVEGNPSLRIQSTGVVGNVVSLFASVNNIDYVLIEQIDGPGTFLSSLGGFNTAKVTVGPYVGPSFTVALNEYDKDTADQFNPAEYEAGIRPPRFDRVTLTRNSLTKDLSLATFYQRGVSIKQLELSYDIDGDLIEVKTL